MTTQTKDIARSHLRRYLAAGYALFIAYVSLSPFTGWQEQGLYFYDVLTAPFAQTFTWFDFSLNLFSYFPFGFLLAYIMQKRWLASRVLLWTSLSGLLMSLSMEYAQMYLPARVSSNTDLLSNTTGAFLGAVFALFIAKHAWVARARTLHNHWFKHGSLYDFGMALIALWVFAQINPSLPMLGSVFISEVARWPFDIVPESPFNWIESAEVALNVLLLGILISTLLRERRLTMNTLLLTLSGVTLIKFIAAAILLKSWALLLWLNSEAVLGIIAGLLLLFVALRLSHPWLLRLGVLSVTFYLLLLQNLLLDNKPVAALRLYHWHYIHMLNYNGFSQIIILLFPVLLLGYLLRLSTHK